jgi:hypothetical protein
MLTLLIDPEPTTLVTLTNPADPSLLVSAKVTEGLLAYDFELNPKPQLATQWAADPDGMGFTFTIREGVKWHDGVDFTAADVAFSITAHVVAVFSKNRTLLLPTVPTAKESGIANFEADAWGAFFLPKGTPDAIVRKLHDASVAAMNTPSVQERLKEIGATVVGPERRSREYLQKFVVSEIEKWGKVIRAAGINAE